MKKKIFSILLIVMLAVSLIPLQVSAATVNLEIGGIALKPGEYLMDGESKPQSSASGTSYAYFHTDGVTLTLSSFSGSAQKTIVADNDLNILLSGTNTLDAGYMSYAGGINVSGDLTIGGQGSLQIVGSTSGACNRNAAIHGENITFRDGAIVSAAGQHIGICASGSITVDGGCKISADGEQSGSAQGFAVYAEKTEVKNGTLILTTNGTDRNDKLCNAVSKLTGYKYYRTTGDYVEGAYTGDAEKVRYLELTTALPISDPIVVEGVSLDRGQYLEQGKMSPINGTPTVDNYVWYDPIASEPTLVMHNFSASVTGQTSYAISTVGDKLVIRLEGSNSLSSHDGMTVRVMRPSPYSSGSLTITGSGSLSLTESGSGGYAIYADTGVTIKGGAQVTVSAPNSTCMQNKDLKIQDMGTRFTSSGKYCVISLNNNSYVTMPEAYEYRNSAGGAMINGAQTPFVPSGSLAYIDILVLHSHVWSDEWSHDGASHWHECEAAGCDITDNKDKGGYNEHGGGTASCTERAVCTECQTPYGNMLEHSYTVPQNDTSSHWNKCASCDATDTPIEHDGTDNGDCTTAVKCSCGYTVTEAKDAHSGGNATCLAKAHCAVCNLEYGELDADNHVKSTFSYTQNADGTTHTKKYECCGAISVSDEAHTYGADGKCACGAQKSVINTEENKTQNQTPNDNQSVPTDKQSVSSDTEAVTPDGGCGSVIGFGGVAFAVVLVGCVLLLTGKKKCS